MQGQCPYCSRESNFREESFGELTKSLFSGIGSFITKSKLGMVATVASEIGSGKWENFRCVSCDRKVHTCGGCGSIEHYQDFGAVCTKCGYR